jgi:hypothetical protein
MSGTRSKNKPEGRRMTTGQVKSMKEWPALEKQIKIAMQRTAMDLKIDLADVELIEETYRWIIRIQGEDMMEIDPRDLSEHPKN